MRTTPHPSPALRAALDRLERGGDLGLALHLALPVDIATSAVLVAGGRLSWRGVRVETGDDPVRAVAVLVAGAHRDGDRYLELGDRPSALVKWIHSGTRRYAHGMTELFDGPQLSAEADINSALLALLVTQAASRARPTPPFVVQGGAGACLVGGDDDAWHAVGDWGSRPGDESPLDRSRQARTVAGQLMGEVETLRDDAVVVRVGRRWDLTVPLDRLDGSFGVEAVATPGGDLSAPPRAIPPGFEVVGCDEGGTTIVVHTPSGIRALLTGDLHSDW